MQFGDKLVALRRDNVNVIYLSPKRICLITTERIDNNNEHHQSWGSILYGLLPQYPQWDCNCCPAVWMSRTMHLVQEQAGWSLERYGHLKHCFAAHRSASTSTSTKYCVIIILGRNKSIFSTNPFHHRTWSTIGLPSRSWDCFVFVFPRYLF